LTLVSDASIKVVDAKGKVGDVSNNSITGSTIPPKVGEG